MKSISLLNPQEAVRLDAERLGYLFAELGEIGAYDILCRALEELTQRLNESERQYRAAEFIELRKTVRSLVGIADQVGMGAMSCVAVHVVDCVDQGDPVALAATLTRLLRVADQSLTAVWNLQGQSV